VCLRKCVRAKRVKEYAECLRLVFEGDKRVQMNRRDWGVQESRGPHLRTVPHTTVMMSVLLPA